MLAFIHGRIALTIVFYAFALGVWASWAYLRRQGVTPSYRGALVIGQFLVTGQGLIGIILVLTGARPADLLHFLYGVLVVLAWPGAYVYTNARTGRREAGLYALVSFFILGLAIRAMMTA